MQIPAIKTSVIEVRAKVDLMNLHTVELAEKVHTVAVELAEENLAVTISQVPSPLVMISLRDWNVQ